MSRFLTYSIVLDSSSIESGRTEDMCEMFLSNSVRKREEGEAGLMIIGSSGGSKGDIFSLLTIGEGNYGNESVTAGKD